MKLKHLLQQIFVQMPNWHKKNLCPDWLHQTLNYFFFVFDMSTSFVMISCDQLKHKLNSHEADINLVLNSLRPSDAYMRW